MRRLTPVLTIVFVLCMGAVTLAADCTRCGKRLKFGWGTCAECKLEITREAAGRATERIREEAPRVRDRVSSGTERLKETWRQHAPEIKARTERLVETAAPVIRDRVERFRREGLPQMGQWGQEAAARLDSAVRGMDRERAGLFLTDLGARFQEHGPQFVECMAHLYSEGRQQLAPMVCGLVDRCRPQIVRLARDPEVQEKLMAGFVAAVSIHDRVQRLKDQSVAQGLDILGNRIPIVVGGRETTLNEWAGAYLTRHCPYLEGTTIESEPVQALTYIFVARDTGYILRDLRVIKDRNGQVRSVAECFEMSSGTDADSIIGALDVAEKTVSLGSSLKSGEGVLESSLAFSSAVRNYPRDRR